jgi:hypothetical protein
MTMNPKVAKLATAIAKAEGFFVSGSLPARLNNPGDLEVGDVGYGVLNGKTRFKNPDAGWMALRHECDLILSSLSRAGYKVSDTFLEFAARWTGNDNAAQWAQAVTQDVGLRVTNTLQDYLAME